MCEVLCAPLHFFNDLISLHMLIQQKYCIFRCKFDFIDDFMIPITNNTSPPLANTSNILTFNCRRSSPVISQTVGVELLTRCQQLAIVNCFVQVRAHVIGPPTTSWPWDSSIPTHVCTWRTGAWLPMNYWLVIIICQMSELLFL